MNEGARGVVGRTIGLCFVPFVFVASLLMIYKTTEYLRMKGVL